MFGQWTMCISIMCLCLAESRKSLEPPKKLTVRALSPRALEVRWRDPGLKGQSRVKAIRSYYSVRYAVANDRKSRKTVVTTQKRGKLTKLVPGTFYDVEVKTNRGRRSSVWSETVRTKTFQLKEASTEQQNVVRNLTAVALTSDSVRLSWQLPRSPDNVVAFTIVTQQVSGQASGLGKQRQKVLTGEIASLVVTGLLPHTLYSFRVQTMQRIGSHPLSKRVVTRTLTAPPSRPPRDVTVRQVNQSSVQVSWLPPPPKSRNGPIIGFILQCRKRNGRRPQLKTFTTVRTVRSFTVSGLPEKQTFRFRVAARTTNGTGPYSRWRTLTLRGMTYPGSRSSEADVGSDRQTTYTESHSQTTDSASRQEIESGNQTRDIGGEVKPPVSTDELLPLPPTDVKVSIKDGSSALITWSAPPVPSCCPIKTYRLHVRNLNDSSTPVEIIKDTTEATLRLDANRAYTVEVKSTSRHGESVASPPVMFSTETDLGFPVVLAMAPPPLTVGQDANLTCSAAGSQPIAFTWYLLDGDRNVEISREDTSPIDFAKAVALTLQTSGPDVVTSSLLMREVSEPGQLTFQCMASSKAGSDKKLLPLVIYEPPSIQSVVNMSVVVGERAKLSCRIRGSPLPVVTWVHQLSGVVYSETSSRQPGSQVQVLGKSLDDDVTRQSSLYISQASPRQAGLYVCQASSVAGSAEAVVRLDVRVPPPPPVSQIQAIPVSPHRVAVSWLPPAHYDRRIAYYTVRYRPGRSGLPRTVDTTSRRVDLTGLDPSTSYFIDVIAFAPNSRGEPGPAVEAITLSNERLEPTEVSVQFINSTIVQVHWKPPSGVDSRHIRGYEVQTRKESSSEVDIIYAGDNKSSSITMKLMDQRTFYVRIVTLTTWEQAAASDWVVARHEGPGPPGKVRRLSAVIEEDQAAVSWVSPLVEGRPGEDNSPLGYKIYYGPVMSHSTLRMVKVGADRNELVIQGLKARTLYTFSLQPFNDHGLGESTSVSASTYEFSPSMARGVRARPLTSTTIHLQWERPVRGKVTRYHIRYWRPGRKDKQSAWLNGAHGEYVAGSLRKNAKYRFEIIPYAGERLGEGVVIFSSTLPDKPEGPPTNIALRAVNSTTFVASWLGPDPEKANGKITGYRLILRAKGGPRLSFIVYSPKKNFTFLNMDVSKPYRLRIAAINVNGTGLFSSWIEASYPNANGPPNKPEQLNITSGDKNLTLHWTEPKFSGTPVQGYVIGFGQFIPEVYRTVVDYTHRQFTIDKLKSQSEYIISLRAFNKIGESPAVYVIGRTKKAIQLIASLEMPTRVKVESYTPSSLEVSWIDPVLEAAEADGNSILKDNRAYLIRYSSIHGEAYSYINTTSLKLHLDGLDPNTPYEVSVKVVRGSEHSSWSLPIANSTLQIAPDNAPGNISIFSVAGTNSEVFLNWTEVSSPYGKVEKYIIYVTDDSDLDVELWNPMEVQQTEARISELEPYSKYYFKLQAQNKGGAGPLSPAVAYSPLIDLTAAPSSVVITDFFSDEMAAIRITWSMPETRAGAITGYLLYYKNNENPSFNKWLKKSERGLSSVMLGLESNSTYLFKVRARYKKYDGPFSEVVSYKTRVDKGNTEKSSSENPIGFGDITTTKL